MELVLAILATVLLAGSVSLVKTLLTVVAPAIIFCAGVIWLVKRAFS